MRRIIVVVINENIPVLKRSRFDSIRDYTPKVINYLQFGLSVHSTHLPLTRYHVYANLNLKKIITSICL